MNEKKYIELTIKEFDEDYFNKDLDDIVMNLYNLKEKCRTLGWYRIRFKNEFYDEEQFLIKLIGTRLETDEEFNKRLDKENKIKEL